MSKDEKELIIIGLLFAIEAQQRTILALVEMNQIGQKLDRVRYEEALRRAEVIRYGIEQQKKELGIREDETNPD